MDVTLLIGNDQTLEVAGLKDEISGEFFATAIVTATIRDSDEQEVAGGTLPITLQYVTPGDDAEGREGLYIGNFEDDLELEDGALYSVEVRADAGSDLVALWRIPAVARYRTG